MSNLAPYAVQESNSKGRQYQVSKAFDRDPFERDRTRILHSAAFRRLQYKTQVFENSDGDNFRTRLTHSLEVANVARSVAKALNLNEALVETLALAHDLGHAPYGHIGQDVLDDLMKTQGGFEHNFQALRVVTELESPYPHHKGLNLTYETLEGILKNCSDRRAREMTESKNPFFMSLGQRFLDRKRPSLEAQVVDWSDAIAYLHADIEDAINMKILDIADVAKMSPKFALFWAKAQILNPMNEENASSVVHQAIRDMMSESIKDLINTSKDAIIQSGVRTLDDVRNSDDLIQFSSSEKREHLALKKLSSQLIYNHPLLNNQRNKQKEIVKELFAAYTQHPEIIYGFNPADPRGTARQAADAIACLTDRGIIRELNRINELGCNVLEKAQKNKTLIIH